MDTKEKYCICRSTDAKTFMIACDKCEEWFHGKCIKITPDAASAIKRYYCTACREIDPTLKIKYKKHKDTHSSSKKDEPSAKQSKKETPKSIKKSSRQCGECDNCTRMDDCGTCDFCKDMKKFGGPFKIRQKCRLRQCKLYGIKSDSEKTQEQITVMPPTVQTPTPPAPPPAKKKPPVAPKPKKPPKPKAPAPAKARKPYTRRKQNENEANSTRQSVDSAPRQCYGPRCVNAARLASKYCSDECGRNLAAMRLIEIMPTRIQQWQSSPCVAELKNRKELEELHKKMLEAKGHLEKLDEKHKLLDRIIERGKKEKVKEEESEEEGSNSEEEEGEEDMELFIYCVTCGHEVRQRNAIKHMEKCFIKAEKDMSFAGSFKSLIGGDTICDHFNASSKTYCKRLKVICPEHSKEPKVADDEICGCPLTKELFTEMDELCKNAKKHCVEHFRWERLRRAEIDADKVRQWMKIDELLERERMIRAAMSNRAGVLGLLLHQTVDHEALQTHHKLHTPIKSEAKAEAKSILPKPTPTATTSKDLSTELKKDVVAMETETTNQNQSHLIPSTVDEVTTSTLTTAKQTIVTVTVRKGLSAGQKPAMLLTQRGNNVTSEHDYYQKPRNEHDYC